MFRENHDRKCNMMQGLCEESKRRRTGRDRVRIQMMSGDRNRDQSVSGEMQVDGHAVQASAQGVKREATC